MTAEKLYLLAAAAAKNSYSPYSGFAVGAALLTEDGTVFTGCNVENASYSVTVCAERVALCTAVAAGYRKFKAIAVAGGRDHSELTVCPPCGLCRQALAEFCGSELSVILSDGEGGIAEHSLGELLPMSFGSSSMEEEK